MKCDRFILVTIPRSGTHSLCAELGVDFSNRDLNKLPCRLHTPQVSEILKVDAPLITTWRDPLAVIIANRSRGIAIDVVMKLVDQWYELKDKRGFKAVFSTEAMTTKLNALDDTFGWKAAYAQRDLDVLERTMGEELNTAREYNWRGMPVQTWWMN